MDASLDITVPEPADRRQPSSAVTDDPVQVQSEPTAPTAFRQLTAAQPIPCEAALKQYRRGLVFLMRRECGNTALAEDLCNEAFRITIARVTSTGLDKPDKFAAFLLQTARNLLLRLKQKETNHRTVTGEQEAIEAYEDPDADPTADEDVDTWARIIEEVLKELPLVRDRKLLVRYYMQEQDKSKICRDLKISKWHFRRVTCRARQRFREILERRFRKSDLL